MRLQWGSNTARVSTPMIAFTKKESPPEIYSWRFSLQLQWMYDLEPVTGFHPSLRFPYVFTVY